MCGQFVTVNAALLRRVNVAEECDIGAKRELLISAVIQVVVRSRVRIKKSSASAEPLSAADSYHRNTS